MKNLRSVILVIFAIFASLSTFAQQVSPYSLSPNWRFGKGSGLNFNSGNFLDPSITVISVPSPATDPTDDVETSTSISDKTGNLAFLTNTMKVYNQAGAVIKNLITDVTCGGSSTGGGIAIPDPASPEDSYYLFIANDHTQGGCAKKGINYYKLKKDGTGQVAVIGTYTQLVPANLADESITAASDGQGNYYIINHDRDNNIFRTFKVDKTGINLVNGDQLKTPKASAKESQQSYMKISPCQNKIAWTGKNEFDGRIILVYEFDRTTGTIGNLIKNISTTDGGSGLEFSPDGNIIYSSREGGIVRYFYLSNNTTGTISGSNSWTMQLGPDGKIYTSGAQSSSAVGVIENPNSPNTTTYKTISLSGDMYRGLSNIAWLNPEAPVIKNTINSCTVNFDYEFLNYFQSAIGVDLATIKWTFGDGATSTDEKPSHTYAANGTYNVTLEFEDATCHHKFTATTQVTVNCGGTTPTCNINAIISDPTDNKTININDTDPVTVDFDGSTSTFDNTSSDPKKYYWIIGSPDTTSSAVFAKTNGTTLNDKSSLTFQQGTTLPEGTYEIYLVIRQGTCLDTTKITLKIDKSTTTPTCTLNLDAEIAPVSDFVLSENDPKTITFDGTGSTGFDNASADPKEFYWINGEKDITKAFATTDQANLTFQHGTALPEGNYKIYLIIKQGLCTDIDSVEFRVSHSATPVCTFDLEPVINAVDEVMVAENMPVVVTFDGTSSIFDPNSSSPKEYFWYINDYIATAPFSTDPVTSITFSLRGKGSQLPEGEYDIYLVTKQGLCTDVTKIHVKATFFYIPNLVTPNNDNKNDKFVITNNPGRFDVVIYNRWGQAVYKEAGYTDGWNLSDMSDGIYFYDVTDTKVSKTYKGWVNVIKKY